MSRPRTLHLLREVLDHEVVDADGVSCGMVDDIELGPAGSATGVKALLLGPGAWTERLPRRLRGLARRVFGQGLVRIPWEEVIQVGEVIRLRSRAEAWGAGELDRRTARWIARLPMS
jgi:sporulation protein YlmC with PRC-barrel domain